MIQSVTHLLEPLGLLPTNSRDAELPSGLYFRMPRLTINAFSLRIFASGKSFDYGLEGLRKGWGGPWGSSRTACELFLDVSSQVSGLSQCSTSTRYVGRPV